MRCTVVAVFLEYEKRLGDGVGGVNVDRGSVAYILLVTLGYGTIHPDRDRNRDRDRKRKARLVTTHHANVDHLHYIDMIMIIGKYVAHITVVLSIL